MGKKEKQEIESLKARNSDLEKKMATERNAAEKLLKEEKENAKAVLKDYTETAEEEKVRAAGPRQEPQWSRMHSAEQTGWPQDPQHMVHVDVESGRSSAPLLAASSGCSTPQCVMRVRTWGRCKGLPVT